LRPTSILILAGIYAGILALRACDYGLHPGSSCLDLRRQDRVYLIREGSQEIAGRLRLQVSRQERFQLPSAQA